jgi:hypothetical protein
VFRRLLGRSRVGPRLSVDMVADIFKRVRRWIKLPEEEVAASSGHSIRVGATQDLLALSGVRNASGALEVDAHANAIR